MPRTTTLALLLMVVLPATTGASCRAVDATNAGSQAGYNTAKQAADAWSKREDQVSVSLGQCLGDISTTITSPVFLSLSGILNKIEQEVCQAAQSEIDQYIPSTIDPWGDMPVPDIPVSATRQPVSSPAPALPPLDEVVPGSADTSEAPVFSLN